MAARVSGANVRWVLPRIRIDVTSFFTERLSDFWGVAVADHNAVADGVLHTLLSHGPRGLVVPRVVGLRSQFFRLYALAAIVAVDHSRRCDLLRADQARLADGRLIIIVVDQVGVITALGIAVVVEGEPF